MFCIFVAVVIESLQNVGIVHSLLVLLLERLDLSCPSQTSHAFCFYLFAFVTWRRSRQLRRTTRSDVWRTPSTKYRKVVPIYLFPCSSSSPLLSPCPPANFHSSPSAVSFSPSLSPSSLRVQLPSPSSSSSSHCSFLGMEPSLRWRSFETDVEETKAYEQK